jgi:MFS family permease
MILDVTLSPFRIIQIYVFQLGMGIFFLFIAFLILKRDKKRLNVLLSSLFIFVFIGVLLNVIYAPLTNIPLITVLSYLTVFFLFGCTIFPVVFNLIVLKSEKIITSKRQAIIILGYLGLFILLFLIPGAIIIEESNNYVPQWNLLFFISLTIIFVGFTAIPFIITAIQISKKFEDPQLKKKWKYYMLSAPFYHLNAVMVGLCNYINNPDLRLMWNAIALLLFAVGYLMYYGVGKQIDKDS